MFRIPALNLTKFAVGTRRSFRDVSFEPLMGDYKLLRKLPLVSLKGERVCLRSELRDGHLTLHLDTEDGRLQDVYDDIMDIDPLQHCQELGFASDILGEIVGSFTIKSLLPDISDNPKLAQAVMQFISNTYDRCLRLPSTLEERKYMLKRERRESMLLTQSIFYNKELRASLDCNGRLLIQAIPLKGNIFRELFRREVKIPKDFFSSGREPKPTNGNPFSSHSTGSSLQDSCDGFDPPDHAVERFLGRLLDTVSPLVGTVQLGIKD